VPKYFRDPPHDLFPAFWKEGVKGEPNALQVFAHDPASPTPLLKPPSLPVSIRTITTRIIRPIMAVMIIVIESWDFLFLSIKYS
jgi:hypothetical protein